MAGSGELYARGTGMGDEGVEAAVGRRAPDEDTAGELELRWEAGGKWRR